MALVVCASLAVGQQARAQTATEAACRALVAGNVRAYVGRVLKTVERCHRLRAKGRISASIDCNDVHQADLRNALDKRRTRIEDVLTDPDGSCAEAAAVLARYARCPSPAAEVDDGGASDGIDDFGELSRCLVASTDALLGEAAKLSLGRYPGLLGRQARRCQKSLGKGLRRLLDAYLAQRTRCQADRDARGLGLGYGCTAFDGTGKILKAAAKLGKQIRYRCALDDTSVLDEREEIDRLDLCGDTPAQLERCVADVVGARIGAGLAAMAYELPSRCLAGSVLRTSHAGFGRRLTHSSFSGGWRGIGHDIDLTDGFRDAMTLDCDDDCGNCELDIDPLANEPHGYCRCVADSSVRCDTLGADDPDDCGQFVDQGCQCFLGPPVGVAASGAPACVSVRIDGAHGGTMDLGTGDWANTIGLSAVMHLGTDLFAPCPLCTGDTIFNDGVADGSCSGGARDGQPCDVHNLHVTFGPSSFDCQPHTLTNISGEGLGLQINMTTADTVLPYTLPCDTAGLMCPCRVCSGDTTQGCHEDAECQALGAGTCTAGGGAGVEPNDCVDKQCGPDARCAQGPIDSFCDGQTYADGRGYITCVSDVDCTVLGAGSCTLSERRPCYTDPIVTGGAPGIFGGIAGTSACIGVTSSVVINQATGLPGAVRVILDFDGEPRCESDPSLVFEPPGGSNCAAVTTSTTTTTLIPPLPCIATFPLCGGSCPTGQACLDTGTGCACQGAATTTTLPSLSCEETFPACSGECAAGAGCRLEPLSLSCLCSP